MTLRAGDWVQVLSAEEILATLDEAGTLDGLVFMPEMLGFCGKVMRVRRGALQVCTDNALVPAGESRVRFFVGGGVLVLEDSRCSGDCHGECKRGCTIFWKERWLQKIPEAASTRGIKKSQATCAIPTRLCTSNPSGLFYCQSSELIRATAHLPLSMRIRNCLTNVRNGNYRLLQMLRMLATWFQSRLQEKLCGTYPRGTCGFTPNEVLNLQAGEWIKVRSFAEIVGTLDHQGKNRGLHFSQDMVPYCGKRLRVRNRVGNLIGEGTGKMWHMQDTVILEGSICNAAIFAFGGCPRDDFLYWRESWLRRMPVPSVEPAAGRLPSKRVVWNDRTIR